MLYENATEKLKDYIKTKNITQRELAMRLGWTPSALNDVLKGRKPVGIKRLLHISHKLGIKFETEFGTTKVSESPPLYLTKDDMIEKLKQKNPPIVDMVKSCIVVSGGELFVEVVTHAQK